MTPKTTIGIDENDWHLFAEQGIIPEHEKLGPQWRKAKEAGADPWSGECLQAAPILPELSSAEQEQIHRASVAITEGLVHCRQLAWVLLDRHGFVRQLLIPELWGGINEPLPIVKGAKTGITELGVHALSEALRDRSLKIFNAQAHSCRSWRHWNSAACPLYNLDGNLIGVIGLLAPRETPVTTMRTTLMYLVQSVDDRTRLHRAWSAHKRVCSDIGELFTHPDQPSLLVSRKGYLRQANPAAIELLELGKRSSETALDDLAHFEPPIEKLADSGLTTTAIEMTIKTSTRRLKVQCDRRPIFGGSDELLGVLLLLREQSRKTRPKETAGLEARYRFYHIIGECPQLKHAKSLARQVAQSQVSVLLQGESGTGKEMFAQAIHNASPSREGPFVSLNCAAIPSDIAESELFGYSEGAFTGAMKGGKAGLVESANGGTLFLDEVGDMPLELQVKLLRVLETRSVSRLGQAASAPVTFRLITATHQDLRELIEKKQFREDLYYRLAVSVISLPSLRSMSEDLPLLFERFINHFNESLGKKIPGVEAELMTLLQSYAWRGNIRELRNTVEYAAMLNLGDEMLGLQHMPGDMRMSLLYRHQETSEEDLLDRDQGPSHEDLRQRQHQNERTLLVKALEQQGGNIDAAAEGLGVSRATLYRHLKKQGIRPREITIRIRRQK